MVLGFRRPLLLSLALVFALLGAMMVRAAAPAQAAVVAPFEVKYSVNAAGAIRLIGNTLLTCSTSEGGNSNKCEQARTAPNSGPRNNNDFTMQYVDADSDASTFNSSSADFELPAGASVLNARLYWGAKKPPSADSMKFKVPGGSYQTVTASGSDVFQTGDSYSASADVTSTVRGAGSGTYWGADVSAKVGGKDLDAGWSLILVVADPTEPVRAMSVFSGFAQVKDKQSVNIDVSGFQTPSSGPVKSAIGIVAFEGDLNIVGDGFAISRKSGPTVGPKQPLSDAARPVTNFFNSTITTPNGQHVTAKNPNYKNQLGFDVGKIDASGRLSNGDTEARLTASTAGDAYYPSAITFESELYSPNVPLNKSAVDLNGGDLEPGDVVRYTIVGQNRGQDAMAGTLLTDTFPDNTTYVADSLLINGTGGHDGDISGQQLSSSLGDLAIGDSLEIIYELTVDDGTPSGTILTNTATVAGSGSDTGIPVTFPSNEVSQEVVNPNADLTITKVGTDQVPGTPGVQFAAGSDATYTLTVGNDGPSLARGPITVQDVLAPGVDFVSATGPGWGCTYASVGREVTCTTDQDLASAGSLEPIALTVNVPADTANETAFANTATATSITPGNPGTTTENVTLVQLNDLAINKRVNGTVVAGQNVSWTLDVSNAGPSVATNVQVSDDVPAGVTFVSATGNDWSCTEDSGSITCDLAGTLGAGLHAPGIEFVGLLSPTAQSVSNTATVTGSGTDTDPSNNTSTSEPNTATQVDATTSVTVPGGNITPGTDGTVKIDSANFGPSAVVTGEQVSISIDVPADLTVNGAVSNDWSCLPATQVGPGEIVCTQTLSAPVGPNASFDSILLDVSLGGGASDPTTIAATITVPNDTNPDNDSSSVNVRGVAVSDVELTSVSDVTVKAGGTSAAVTFTVKNLGPSTDSGEFTTTVALPPGITVTEASSGWNCSQSGTLLTCTKTLSLATDETADLVLDVSAPVDTEPGDLSLQGRVISPADDPNLLNNTAVALVHVIQEVNLVPLKTVADPEIVAGESTTYTLSVTNNGPSKAKNIRIDDDLTGSGLRITGTPTASSGLTCTNTAITISCAKANLDLAATATVSFDVASDPGIADGTVLTNTMAVSTSTPLGPDSVPTATADLLVNRFSTLGIEKVAVDESSGAITSTLVGDTIRYAITVSNSGPSNTTGVTVTDTLPADLAYISATGSQWSCSEVSGSITCENPTLSLAPGQQAPVIFVTAAVDAFATAPTVTNSATATPTSTGDPATSQSQIDLTPAVDLAVIHSGNATVDATGQWDTTVDVYNFGPSDETGPISVAITVSPGALNPIATGSGWTCDFVEPIITCETGAGLAASAGLPPISISATADPGSTELFSTAVVAGSGNAVDTNPANNTDATSAQINGIADMTVVKSVRGPSAVPVGGVVIFDVTVTNNGPTAAAAVFALDSFSSGLVFNQEQSDPRCADESGPLSCSAATLVSGESTSFTVAGTVTAQGALSNTVTVSSAETDPNPDNNSGKATATGTDPIQPQVPDTLPPSKIKANGKTTIVPNTVYSNAGQKVRVSVSCTSLKVSNRGDLRLCKVKRNKKTGAVKVKTFNKRVKVEVGYRAPAVAGYTKLKENFTYKVKPKR